MPHFLLLHLHLSLALGLVTGTTPASYSSAVSLTATLEPLDRGTRRLEQGQHTEWTRKKKNNHSEPLLGRRSQEWPLRECIAILGKSLSDLLCHSFTTEFILENISHIFCSFLGLSLKNGQKDVLLGSCNENN